MACIAPDMVEMGVHIKEAFATHFVEHHRPCGHAWIVGVPSFGAGDIHLLRFCNPEVARFLHHKAVALVEYRCMLAPLLAVVAPHTDVVVVGQSLK